MFATASCLRSALRCIRASNTGAFVLDLAGSALRGRKGASTASTNCKALKRNFESKTGTGKDQALTFEDMGVDFVYVDEAHEFRKLDYATNRAVKGIDPNGSQRALDLYIKTRWLEQQNPGRSLVIVTHDARVFEFADRIAKMNDVHVERVVTSAKELR